ncbi:MAG: hypothetical protein JST30_14335 [Armatimonadetes bacterium]|nr:hypothetical protein [Armatimonadota bacterium]
MTLLIVGGLLVAGAIVLAPVFMSPHKGRALRYRKVSNVRQILTAVQMYATDNDGRLPPDTSTGRTIYAAVGSYVRNEGVLDTFNPKSPEWLGNGSLGGRVVDRIPDPFRTLLIFESAPTVPPGGKDPVRVVGNVDGMARSLPEAVFQEALKDGLRTP